MSFGTPVDALRPGRGRSAAAIALVYVMVHISMSTPVRADWFSNNTTKFLSDNNIQIRDNIFYTPITNQFSVALQLTSAPWGSIIGTVFSLISSQLERDESNRRFDEMNQALRQMMAQLGVMNAKLDRIELALLQISDKNDQILDAVHALPARLAYGYVLRDINNIEDHWNTWQRPTLTASDRSRMKDAYDDLHRDATLLSTEGDPLFTPALAIALRLELDLIPKLKLGSNEANDAKKGYKRFLDAALAPAAAITPGDPVQPKDSFPVRLAKRRALIAMYLGDKHTPPINFGASCSQAYGEWSDGVGSELWGGRYFGNTSAKDSFVWDPPTGGDVLVRLIRANAVKDVAGPIDERLIHSQIGVRNTDELVQTGTLPDCYAMRGAWDLMAAVRMSGTTFEYLGAYYRPSHLDLCLGGAAPGQHFGVLTPGTTLATRWAEPKKTGQDPPTRPEEFFQRYGKVADNDVTVFVQERLAQANRQAQLMGNEAIAFAATSEFREVLNRLR